MVNEIIESLTASPLGAHSVPALCMVQDPVMRTRKGEAIWSHLEFADQRGGGQYPES